MKRDRSWYFDAAALVTRDDRFEIAPADPTDPRYYVIVDRCCDSVVAINGRTSWPFQRDAREALTRVLKGRLVMEPREPGEFLRVGPTA